MSIDIYAGVPAEEIVAKRVTSEGKIYSLNHPEGLVVNMRYKGTGMPNSNSQGWERSSSYYFKELQGKHPEFFSKKNTIRIEKGESPRVDTQFVKNFPQYKGYENEILIHHHVGKDGQAVAVPQSIHKGSGEIHVYENELGITDAAKKFSDQCQDICEKHPNRIGETSDQFKGTTKASRQGPAAKRKNAITQVATSPHIVSSSKETSNAISVVAEKHTEHSKIKVDEQIRQRT